MNGNSWNIFTSVASRRETFSTYENHYTALGPSISSTMSRLHYNRELRRLVPTALSIFRPFEVLSDMMTPIRTFTDKHNSIITDIESVGTEVLG
jgi:hypothetical protein